MVCFFLFWNIFGLGLVKIALSIYDEKIIYILISDVTLFLFEIFLLLFC
jgi:hypothetical protein